MRLNHTWVLLTVFLLMVTILSPLQGAQVWTGGYRYGLAGYDGSKYWSAGPPDE